MTDNTDNPLNYQEGGDHYKKFDPEPIEFCYCNQLNNIQSEIISYVARFRFKNGVPDLKKAKHTLQIWGHLYEGGKFETTKITYYPVKDFVNNDHLDFYQQMIIENVVEMGIMDDSTQFHEMVDITEAIFDDLIDEELQSAETQ